MDKGSKPLQDITAYEIESTAPSYGVHFEKNIYFEFEVPVNQVYINGDSYTVIELEATKNAANDELDIANDGFDNCFEDVFFTEQIMELNGVEVDRIRYPWHSNILRLLTKEGYEKLLKNYSGSTFSTNSINFTKLYNGAGSNGLTYIRDRNINQLYNTTTKRMVIVQRNKLFKDGGNILGNNRVRLINRVNPSWYSDIYVGNNTPTYMGTPADNFVRFEVKSCRFIALQYQSIEEPISKTISTDYERIFTEQRVIPSGSKHIEFDLPIEPSTIRGFGMMFTLERKTQPSDFLGIPEIGTAVERISVHYKNVQYPRNEYYFGGMATSNEEDVTEAYHDFLVNTEFINGSASLSLLEWRTLFPVFYFRVFEESDDIKLRNVMHFNITFTANIPTNILITVVPFSRHRMEQQYNQYAVPSKGLILENISYQPNKTSIQLDKEDEVREEMETMDT